LSVKKTEKRRKYTFIQIRIQSTLHVVND